MDPRERFQDYLEAVKTSQDGMQGTIFTALPGIVESVNLEAATVEVQPAVKATVAKKDGTSELVDLPLLPDVPIVWPRGGGYVATFPIKKGDECLLVFSMRSIDAWWSGGGVQAPLFTQLHDINDSFAIFGPYSKPNVVSDVNPDAAVLRSEDGSVSVTVDQPSGQVSLYAATRVMIESPLTLITRDVQVGGSVKVTGDVTAGTVSLEKHVHTNAGGTGNSGPPAQ
jgi:hypothetical protein